MSFVRDLQDCGSYRIVTVAVPPSALQGNKRAMKLQFNDPPCVTYFVEAGTITFSEIRAVAAVVVHIERGEGQSVVAEEGIPSVAQMHRLEVEAVLVALRADAEPLVAGKALVSAPVLQIDGQFVLFLVVAVCQRPQQNVAYHPQ